MSIFAENITNNDDIVLSEFRLKWSTQYKTHILEPKPRNHDDFGNWVNPTFVPAEVIWKWYMNRGGMDDIKYGFGFHIQPDKKKFCDYIRQYPDIRKLEFRNNMYYSLAILHPMFDAFNNWILEDYMKRRFKETHEDNEF